MIVSDRILQSCGPVVRTERMELVRIVDIDGRGKRGTLGFEADISWVREAGAKVFFEHGGQVLKEGSGFCDVGRFMTCLDSAMEEGSRLCRRYSITAESTLAVLVEATITEIPILRSREPPMRAIFGRFEHERVPKDWLRNEPEAIKAWLEWQADQAKPFPEGGLPRLEGQEIAVERIWRSPRSQADNDRAVAEFRRRWTP
jgi:hypothetical protein